jgi:threonine/homoserine/homoserine lactone efflux protein
LAGGLFLIFLGIKTIFAKAELDEDPDTNQDSSRGMIRYYMSTFFLTISNPLTIISFAAIFAGIGAANNNSQGFFAAMMMVLGIFIGSSIWWLSLTFITGLLRQRINRKTLIWINRAAGAVIVLFGILALISIQSHPFIN